MTNDLFKSKEEQLLDFCEKVGYFSTADIMQYGIDTHYLRARRSIHDLIKKEKIEKMSKDECLFRGLKGKMAWYKIKGE